MIYYLLANNSNINSSHIDQIEFDSGNILILFNYMYPMKFDKVCNYSNKYLVSRLRSDIESPNTYAGLESIGSIYNKFVKIFINPYNKDIAEDAGIRYNIDIYEMESILGDLKILCRYPRFKNMSTGFITYNYLQKIKNNNDKIVLIGFTSEVSKYFHSPSWEARFFREEIIKKNCEQIW